MTLLLAVRLPIAWASYGLPAPYLAGDTVVAEGEPAWAWEGSTPDLGVASYPPDTGPAAAGWGVDHVVLLVPDADAAVATLQAAGANLRLRMTVRDRSTAFFRVGTVLEVIETGVPAPRLYGVALVTDEPLDELAARWRDAGHDVSDPRPAIQEGRHILTVRNAGAGFAVMSPETDKG